MRLVFISHRARQLPFAPAVRTAFAARCSKRAGLGVISSMSPEPAPASQFSFGAACAVVAFLFSPTTRRVGKSGHGAKSPEEGGKV